LGSLDQFCGSHQPFLQGEGTMRGEMDIHPPDCKRSVPL
jgi:hypothetical protein